MQPINASGVCECLGSQHCVYCTPTMRNETNWPQPNAKFSIVTNRNIHDILPKLWVVIVSREVQYEGSNIEGVYSTMEKAVADFPNIVHGRVKDSHWEKDTPSETRAGHISKSYQYMSDTFYTFYWYEVK